MPTHLELAIMAEDIYHNTSKLKGDWKRVLDSRNASTNGFFGKNIETRRKRTTL
jgi:hypothetical protein